LKNQFIEILKKKSRIKKPLKKLLRANQSMKKELKLCKTKMKKRKNLKKSQLDQVHITPKIITIKERVRANTTITEEAMVKIKKQMNQKDAA